MVLYCQYIVFLILTQTPLKSHHKGYSLTEHHTLVLIFVWLFSSLLKNDFFFTSNYKLHSSH